MKTAHALLGCLVLVIASAIARGGDSIPVLRVESSRTMKVAIINADQSNPASQRLMKAFAESLSFEISKGYKTPLPLLPVIVEARSAAEGLANGKYDLVAVIGSNIPGALVSNDFKRLRAVPATGNQKHILNLLVMKDDRTLSAMLDDAFPTALNETFFQLAFAQYRKSAVEREKTQWSVAVATLQ